MSKPKPDIAFTIEAFFGFKPKDPDAPPPPPKKRAQKRTAPEPILAVPTPLPVESEPSPNPVRTEPEPEPEPEPLKFKEPREEFDCGHNNWYTKDEIEAARAADFCCPGGKTKTVPDWLALRGKYRRPIPLAFRRTPEKERSGGWPGYCCDDEGYYIGGTGNNCLQNRIPGAPRCPAHRPKDPLPPEDEPPTPKPRRKKENP